MARTVIEMECFEVTKFMELAAEAEFIRINETQFEFLRKNWVISSKMWVDGDTWMIFDADIIIENPVDEGMPRSIVFEMFDYAALGLELPFIPYKQTIEHNPPHQIGNCMQVCIAGLLGKQIHEVPHFGLGLTFDRKNPTLREQEGIEFMNRVHTYLKSVGYRFFEVFYNVTLKELKDLLKMNSQVPLLVAGVSERGTNHSVIMYDGEVYDPHPDNIGLTGPMDNGVFSVGALVKIPGYFAKQV